MKNGELLAWLDRQRKLLRFDSTVQVLWAHGRWRVTLGWKDYYGKSLRGVLLAAVKGERPPTDKELRRMCR